MHPSIDHSMKCFHSVSVSAFVFLVLETFVLVWAVQVLVVVGEGREEETALQGQSELANVL